MRAYSSSSRRRRGRQYQPSTPTTSSTTHTMKIGRRLMAKSNQLIWPSSLREICGIDVPELHLGAEHLEISQERVHLRRLGRRAIDRLEDRGTRIAREQAAGVFFRIQIHQLFVLSDFKHLVAEKYTDRAGGPEMIGDILSIK